jgi:predicted acylesterase/phospholipase RssA
MKPNIKNLIKNYGLVPKEKVRKVLSEACQRFLGKSDITFEELFEINPIKLHIAAYCVDLMKTVYFSVDTTPKLSVIDAVCATLAIPFLFSAIKMPDGWSYIDGGTEENVPVGPFLARDEVLALRIGWGRLGEIKDIKDYALSILYSTLKMRYNYECPIIDVETRDDEIWNFGASNDSKFRMFMAGYSQNIL